MLNFGKYQYEPLSEIPAQYLLWAAAQSSIQLDYPNDVAMILEEISERVHQGTMADELIDAARYRQRERERQWKEEMDARVEQRRREVAAGIV